MRRNNRAQKKGKGDSVVECGSTAGRHKIWQRTGKEDDRAVSQEKIRQAKKTVAREKRGIGEMGRDRDGTTEKKEMFKTAEQIKRRGRM